MAQRVRSVSPAPSPAPALAPAADPGALWMEMIMQATQAWFGAWQAMTQASLSAMQSQAALFAPFAQAVPFAGLAPNVGDLLREELLMAESAAEHMSDAARFTLRDIAVHDGAALPD